MSSVGNNITCNSNSVQEKEVDSTNKTNKKKKTKKNILVITSSLILISLCIASRFILIPYVLHLLILVTCILYTACHVSLQLLQDQALARGEVDPSSTNNNSTTEDTPSSSSSSTITVETLRKEDAMKMPLMGSLALFSLYIAFKFFDKDTVNKIISIYFGFVGCLALTATGSSLLSFLTVQLLNSNTVALNVLNCNFHYDLQIKAPTFLPSSWFLTEEKKNDTYNDTTTTTTTTPAYLLDLSIDITIGDVLSFIASILFTYLYMIQKKWWMNNIIGICFCIMGIQQFSLGTYKIGAIMLIGLFFYDIFWVFGTPVMVSVAKNLDGPIKILFPRTLIPDPVSGKIDTSLLGLGDIIVPGFFLALLLRFDAYKAKLPYFPQVNIHDSFAKPYFHSALIGYILGMGLTMFVMIYFKAAQPALLYLVPAVLGSSFVTALIRGEVKELLAYSEEVEDKNEEKNKNDQDTTTSDHKKDQ